MALLPRTVDLLCNGFYLCRSRDMATTAIARDSRLDHLLAA